MSSLDAELFSLFEYTTGLWTLKPFSINKYRISPGLSFIPTTISSFWRFSKLWLMYMQHRDIFTKNISEFVLSNETIFNLKIDICSMTCAPIIDFERRFVPFFTNIL